MARDILNFNTTSFTRALLTLSLFNFSYCPHLTTPHHCSVARVALLPGAGLQPHPLGATQALPSGDRPERVAGLHNNNGWHRASGLRIKRNLQNFL